jgi:hypothetical protein
MVELNLENIVHFETKKPLEFQGTLPRYYDWFVMYSMICETAQKIMKIISTC